MRPYGLLQGHHQGSADCWGARRALFLRPFYPLKIGRVSLWYLSAASRYATAASAPKGLGLFGAFASALVGYGGRLGHGEWLVGQPDMHEETDEDESDHEELVKQRMRRHDEASSMGVEEAHYTPFV